MNDWMTYESGFGDGGFGGFESDTCGADFGFDPYESTWSDTVGSGMGAGFDFTGTDVNSMYDQWSQNFAYDQNEALGGLYDQQQTQATWASDGIDRSVADDPSEWDPAYGPQVDSYYTPYQSSIGYSSYDTSFIEPANASSSMSMISSNGDPGL